MKEYKRPIIKIKVYKIEYDKSIIWEIFKKEHYLSNKLAISAECFIAAWGNTIVAFNSALSMPSGSTKNAYREHRLVVLSDYQGLGIGNTLSEFIGEYYKRKNKKYYSKTANIKLGKYRDKSKNWIETASNKKKITKYYLKDIEEKRGMYTMLSKESVGRFCYSHKYVGNNNNYTINIDDMNIKINDSMNENNYLF